MLFINFNNLDFSPLERFKPLTILYVKYRKSDRTAGIFLSKTTVNFRVLQ
jgi:hypothetical protein